MRFLDVSRIKANEQYCDITLFYNNRQVSKNGGLVSLSLPRPPRLSQFQPRPQYSSRYHYTYNQSSPLSTRGRGRGRGRGRVEWNGMEWNGMEWNGMEWNGMTLMYSTTSIKNISTVFEHEYESEAERKWRQRYARETDILSRIIARERQLRRPLVMSDLENSLFERSEIDSISVLLPWLLTREDQGGSV